jgi:hypothetical protein
MKVDPLGISLLKIVEIRLESREEGVHHEFVVISDGVVVALHCSLSV